MDELPRKKELCAAILEVMSAHDGSMKTAEINAEVISLLGIPADMLEIEDANFTGTEYSYRMRWARTELKNQNKISSPKKGIWELNKE